MMLTSCSTASRIGMERKCAFGTTQLQQIHWTDKHLLIRSAGSVEAPTLFFPLRDKDITGAKQKSRRTDIWESETWLSRNFLTASGRCYHVQTLCCDLSAGLCGLSRFYGTGTDPLIWPGATRCTCPTNMKEKEKNYVVEGSAQIVSRERVRWGILQPSEISFQDVSMLGSSWEPRHRCCHLPSTSVFPRWLKADRTN